MEKEAEISLVYAQIVTLPTTNKSRLFFDSTGILVYDPHYGESIFTWTDVSCQNLYFLSKDKIKVGDWYYDSSRFLIAQTLDKHEAEFLNEMQKNRYFQIITTTDESVNKEIPCPDGIEGCEVLHLKRLPEPSYEFLIEYTKLFNARKQVKEVMVEYQNINKGWQLLAINDKTGSTVVPDEYKLIVNEGENTINIQLLHTGIKL